MADGIIWADQSCRISGTLSLAIRNASDEQIDAMLDQMLADGCTTMADAPRWLNANYRATLNSIAFRPMTRKPTYAEIAADFDLWREYVDTDGVMSREDFDAISAADRISTQIETFGAEVIVPTVDEMLERTRVGSGLHEWPVEGGTIRVTRAELLPALEAAYDSIMPDWPATVDI